MGSVAVETELKLRLPPDSLERVARHPLLRRGERLPTQKLRAVYYDTPELDLGRHGAALRVRREDNRWVQCVKWGGASQGGLHARNEIEMELSAPTPDLTRIESSIAHGMFRSPQVAAGLRPVFETNFTRSRRLLVLDDGSVVEASIDHGEIRSGDRAEPVSELELELKRGAAPALFQIALSIAERVPVFLENRSKAQRGHALYRATPQAPVKAVTPALRVDMTVSDAFGAVGWESLEHLHANEPGVLEGRDPEYLHQMRVALRRLRSAFGAFSRALPENAGDAVIHDLRWLGATLGPARDWDVFVTETLPAIRNVIADTAALKELAEETATRRAAAQGRVRRTIQSRRYQRAMLQVASWFAAQTWREKASADEPGLLDTPVRVYAQTELERRYERVRKRGRKLGELDAAGRHQLRIAIKKLRYSVEFFAALFDAEAARSLKTRLARLQDVLGTMNDAVTLRRLLEGVFADTRDFAMAEARGILFGWSAGRGDALRSELNRAWRAFRRSETFW